MSDNPEVKYVLSFKKLVIFPGTIITMQISHNELSKCILEGEKVIIAPATEEGEIEDVGCLCELLQVHRLSSKDTLFVLKGDERVSFKYGKRIHPGCYEVISYEILDEVKASPEEEREIKEKLIELLWDLNPNLANVYEKLAPLIPLGIIIDQVSFLSPLPFEEKLEVLKELDLRRRGMRVLGALEEILKDWPIRYYKLEKVAQYPRWIGVNVN